MSFLTKISARRATYLRLAGQIEGQLRDAYHRRFHADKVNQSALAKKLGVGRSVINRRLTGQQNMTVSTVADMVWALDCAIDVKIYDPIEQAIKVAPDPTTSANVVDLDDYRNVQIFSTAA